MRSICSHLCLMLLLAAGSGLPQVVRAAEPADKKPIREIFVPFEDLQVILDAQPRRVFITREEYDALIAQARETRDPQAPIEATVLSADYEITVEEGRARVTGTLEIEVLAEGLHAVGLALSGAGLRRAALDQAGAPIIDCGDGQLSLLVEGRGRHTLLLDLVLPVTVDAAQQTLSIKLPQAPAARLKLNVPGNIEIKSGAEVLTRRFDAEAGITRFELLPARGAASIVMSLNNRIAREQRVVVARSVLVAELTEAYQRLHATFSLNVLHGTAERFHFRIPDGFEVTTVETPLLARWQIAPDDEQRVLEVALREPATEIVVVHLSAIRTPGGIDDWTLPTFEPLDVAGYVAVVGLLVEDRLQPQLLEPEGLIPIDAQVLTDALPASLLESEPGAPPIRPLAAYYAPQADFSLRVQLAKQLARVQATTNLLLVLEDSGLSVRGGFALLPAAEKLFGCEFSVPRGWQVNEVTYNDQPLAFERYETKQGARVEVRLPHGVPAGELYSILFRATSTPAGWLDDWKSIEVDFPLFLIQGASQQVGALAVQARDDLVVRPKKLTGLIPLDENQKAAHHLGDVPTNLAYRFEGAPVEAVLTVERTEPRITARAFSMLKIEPDELVAHYEVLYEISEARARRLVLSLPAGTPSEVAITGHDGVAIKGFESRMVGEQRRWIVDLQQARLGTARLAVDFRQPRDEQPGLKTLPLVRAAEVAYQSGVVAVEGSAELDVELVEHPRKIDVGELVDAHYQPGRRLLGVYGFPGDVGAVKVNIRRAARYTLPAAIVQRAELVTLVSSSGVSQTAARFELRTKALFLEVQLPAGADLWSVYLDGRPCAPQRQGESLLISLPASEEAGLRDLQIVYELPVSWLRLWNEIEVLAPRLLLRADEAATGRELPVADLVWHLHLPNGYRLESSDGTVFTDELRDHRLPAFAIGRTLISSPTLLARREAARVDFAAPAMDAAEEQLDAAARAPTPPQEESAEEPATPQAEPTPADPAPAFREEQAGQRSSSAARPKYWALQGVRSLKIELTETGRGVTFQSLGANPRMEVTLVNQQRLDLLGWGLALGVGVIGLALSFASWRRKLTLVFGTMLIATLVSILFGGDVWGKWFDRVFLAAMWVLVYFFIVGASVKLWSVRRWFTRRDAAPAGLIAMCLATGWTSAQAQETVLVRPAPPVPVQVPDEALIVPFDPSDPQGPAQSTKLLVPYEKYVELWNAANPTQKLETDAPPAAYALAGAEFSARLAGEQQFIVTGRLEIEVFQDEVVVVPLHLSGGVLTEATIEGRPARLQIVHPTSLPQAHDNAGRQQAAPAGPALPNPEPLVRLYLSGAGRHTLQLGLRYPLTPQGGWRVARGRLPAAPATTLVLHVPEAGTEVRLSDLPDRSRFETEADDETLHTIVGSEGRFGIQWRPQVAEAMVDQSLTIESDAVLDVQEDGLRLAWQFALAFRSGQRETFTVRLPQDYLVESVTGDNIRGWQLEAEENAPQLEVTLLKPARERETFLVHLTRRGAVGREALQEFTAPVLDVEDAALHLGRLAIRRSPLLELRTLQADGLTRTDQTEMGSALAAAVDSEESPLGIRPYQTYRFVAAPFSLRLAAAPTAARTTAQVQAVLNIAQRERSLETRIRLRVEGRPLFQLQVRAPADWKLDDVLAPEPFDWSIEQLETEQLLTLYLSSGQRGAFSIVLRGQLGESGSMDTIALPTLEVLEAARQELDLVVQADPALEIGIEQLQNAEAVLLARVYDWLPPAQRRLARVAIHAEGADYVGLLRLTARRPRVACTSASNVRVTDRAFEETILLDYTIRDAGINQVSFLLPEWMQDARLRVPLLRQTKLEAVTTRDGAKLVRVTLELQDEVMGELRVLVENDRAVTAAQYTVPIPVIEAAQTERRFVALESAGRDELVVDQQRGLERLSRQQSEWRRLTALLGHELTHAYVATDADVRPRLTFHARDRAAVETAGARIGLAQAVLTLDANGAYRAVQVYHMDNATEQFLVVQLPIGAVLWTASVAGEPVKPARVAGQADQVRIPLVKTAAGDQDFEVALKYGGELARLGRLRSVRFPLLRTVNVHVEMSQVRLRLPESHRWFNIDGTMRLVEDEADLAAQLLSYQTRQIKRLSELLSVAGGSSYEKVRAKSNLKQLNAELQSVQQKSRSLRGNKQLQQELRSNTEALRKAEAQIAQEDPTSQDAVIDNRARLNTLYEQQQNQRSRNVAGKLGDAFELDDQRQTPPDGQNAKGGFNERWLDKSKLGKARPDDAPASSRLSPAKPAGKAPAAPANQPQAPDLTVGESVEEQRAAQQEFDQRAGRRSGDYAESQQRLRRYEAQLESAQALQHRLDPLDLTPGHAGLPAVDEDAPHFASGPALRGQADRNGAQPAWRGGLASLDVVIPQRGVEYLLITPRGDVEITARAVAKPLLNRVQRFAVLTVVLIALVALVRLAKRHGYVDWIGQKTAMALILAGVLSLLLGLAPLLGLAALVLGLVQLVRIYAIARFAAHRQV